MVECCNTPDVIYLICNPTLAVSGVKLFYFLGFGFLSLCVVVVSMHLLSCHHVHCICIRVRHMDPSIFPVVRFPIRRSYLLWRIRLFFFRVRVSNFLGMDRGLSGGLNIPPGDYRSSFVSFGGRLVLQRLTGHPQSPFECPAKPPLQNQPKTHQTLFHALGRSITIVWAKTAPHLESPSSLYL